jgi:ketosteroid isomerase-like protein
MASVIKKVGLIFCTFVIITSQVFPGDDLEQLKQKLQALNDKLVEANFAGDWDTTFSYFTDDVLSMPNFDKVIKGKEALRKYQEYLWKSMKFHSVKFTTEEVWTCGDLVYEIGKYKMIVTLSGYTQPTTNYGKYFTIWQKQLDGSLKVKYEIWNTDGFQAPQKSHQ